MSEPARGALADALASRGILDGARVLDLFAGTGALSFEAISRGADRALLVDHDRDAARSIRASADKLGIVDRVRVVSRDLLSDPDHVAADLAQAVEARFSLVSVAPPDPHTPATRALAAAMAASGAPRGGACVVTEHPARIPLPCPAGLAAAARYRYGDK